MTLIHPTIRNLALSLCSKSICHFTISHLHVSYHLPTYCSIFPGVSSVQFSSVAQSFQTLGDPMNSSMPGFPVHQQLLELCQTHGHQISDAIQPSHPLLSPSPPALTTTLPLSFLESTLANHEVRCMSRLLSLPDTNQVLSSLLIETL